MNTSKAIDLAKKIIDIELEGIQALKENLSEDFTKVCELLLNCKGRVVLSGIGKSGHIANKIAATLASTGTSALFVHPAEALHGDLGMISREDVVIAISNSGNTVEFQGIVGYVSRFDIPFVAITTNKDSLIGNAANYCLLLPKAKEACSLGLAPTTSTTNSLVLGDALAITLLEIKGFSSEDFKVFHPGGSLGAKLIKVSDIMHKIDSIPLIANGSLMSEAILLITSHKFGCTGIVDKSGNMIGIITDGDIRKFMSDNLLNKSVEQIMNPDFVFIEEDMNTSKALLLMENKKITSLFVLSNRKPVGIIHIHDLLRLNVL